MAQRLVLGTDETVTLAELRDFVTKAEKIGLTGRSVIGFDHFTPENGGKEKFRFHIVLPDERRMKITKIVRKSKKQKEVSDRIDKRKEAIANGEEVEGYVPPVGKSGPPKTRKGKCIECNVRKPLVKGLTGSKPVVKEHRIKGVICPGSGKPPLKFKNKG